MSKKSIYFSLFGGYLYEADEQEEKILDSFQVPLIDMPSTSCKCYGRFHTGYDLQQKHFIICKKCAKELIDVKKLLARKNVNQ